MTESMVAVKVLLMGELRLLAGQRELSLELPEGGTLSDLAGELSAICGKALTDRVLTPRGEFHPHLLIAINGEEVRHVGNGEALISNAEVELMILPIIEGGS